MGKLVAVSSFNEHVCEIMAVGAIWEIIGEIIGEIPNDCIPT